jgi:2-methylcitrate dehydratase PrpD
MRPPIEPTAALVDYVLHTSFDQLAASARHATRRIALDTLGAMLAASAQPDGLARVLETYASLEGGAPRASIIGRQQRTGPALAALVNGALAYALDLESIHGPSITHAAAVVVPACLAVGEACGATGAELVAAIGVGLDAADRISRAIGPRAMYARGIHPSAVAGAPAAALAGARLLGLDHVHARRALGLAALQASGLMAWETDASEHSRAFNCGLAARNGVTAALLAAQGFGGPKDALVGPHGMLGAFGDADSSADVLADGLGERFAACETQIKRYACCAFLQPGVDAMVGLKTAHALELQSVATITFEFPRAGAAIIDNNPVRSHSAQYVLPVALAGGDVTFADLATDRRLTEPSLRALGERVRVVHSDELDPEFPDRYTSRVRLDLHDGRSVESLVVYATGHPENPMSDARLQAKFEGLVMPALGIAETQTVLRLIAELPEADSLAPLMTHLREPSGAYTRA